MSARVGIVRDGRFMLHKPGLVHPDRPDRLTAVHAMLAKEFGETLAVIQPEPATLEQLELVHTPAYIRKVLRTAERKFTYLAPDTPVSSQSYLSACLAVGACIKGVQALLSGRSESCFALVRPPGHHAMPDRASGFCVFNNLGVAARYALSRHGLERILIVDWDIHHGNALQHLFYNERQVLYFSSHVPGWFPRTGHMDEAGEGEGAGYTINVELPKNIGDADLTALYAGILTPVMTNYRPELIMVAAGFDGHYLDTVGGTELTQDCFSAMTHLLLALKATIDNPPILLALEGGYDATALSDCVKVVLEVLVNGSRAELPAPPMSRKAQELFDSVRLTHDGFGVWA